MTSPKNRVRRSRLDHLSMRVLRMEQALEWMMTEALKQQRDSENLIKVPALRPRDIPRPLPGGKR